MQSGQNTYKQAENPLCSGTGENNLLIIDPVFVNTPGTVFFFKFFPFSYSCRVIKNQVFVVVGLFMLLTQ